MNCVCQTDVLPQADPLTRQCSAAIVTFLGESASLVDEESTDRLVWILVHKSKDKERLKRASVCLMTLGTRDCPSELTKLLYSEVCERENTNSSPV